MERTSNLAEYTAMTEHPVLFQLARQRSGANFLGGLLASASGGTVLGEILEPPDSKPMHRSFWKWLQSEPARQSSFADPLNRHDILDDYLSDASQHADGSMQIVDIKYNSCHHFERIWSYGGRATGLVEFANKRSLPLVHLVRTNLLAQLVSLKRAEKTGSFHHWAGDPADKNVWEPVELPLGWTIRRLRDMIAESGRVSSDISEAKRFIEIKYEDLIGDIDTQRTAIGEIGEALDLDLDLTLMKASTRKIGSGSLKDDLSNYSEIVDAVRIEGLGHLLEFD